MKLDFKILILFLAVLFVGCEEENTLEIISPDGIVLSDPGIGILVINSQNLDNQAFNITWTDNTGTSGTYNIDFATDDLFENSTTIGSTDTNSFTFTQTEVNNTLATLNSVPFAENTAYLRVSSGSDVSNSITFIVIPVQDTPILQSPMGGDTYTLVIDNASEEVFMAQWAFLNDVNLDITYDVEVAIAGTSFATTESVATVNNENSISISTSDLNAAAVALGIEAEDTGDLDLRIKASYMDTNNMMVEELSNSVTFTVTTYNAVFPYLYLVGASTAAGWDNNNDNPSVFRSQDTPNSYYFTGYFTPGGFKILEALGNWHPQWGDRDNSGTLGVSNPDGSNEAGTFDVPSAGYYTFTATSMTEGANYTIESFDASGATTYTSIGIIGQAIGGWGDADEIQMTQRDPVNNPHLWYAENVNILNSAEADQGFLIRPNGVWDLGAWRYTGSQELYGQANLAGGGDNFVFNGPTGSYDVWFNDLDGSYVIIPN